MTATKKESALERLRFEIVSGALMPGMRLVQKDIADRLGLSVTPVREAFRILEAEGVLVNRPHRGVVVSRPDIDQIAEAYELRSLVEGWIVRRLASMAKKTYLPALKRTLTEGRAALRELDAHAFRTASIKFHDTLAEASGARLANDVVRLLVSRSLPLIPYNRARMVRVLSEHQQIIRLLEERDGRQAQQIMMRHCESWVKGLKTAQRGAVPPLTVFERVPIQTTKRQAKGK